MVKYTHLYMVYDMTRMNYCINHWDSTVQSYEQNPTNILEMLSKHLQPRNFTAYYYARKMISPNLKFNIVLLEFKCKTTH